MKYHELEDVVTRPGLRLILTEGLPGPWGLAARALFDVKGIDYLAAAQRPDQDNQLLAELTGQTSAPVALYDDEKPAVLWNEIILLAERLAPQPALIPTDPLQRAQMFGLIHELVGPGGFGWCRRLQMFQPMMELPDPGPMMTSLGRKYGYTHAAAADASERCLTFLNALAGLLQEQGGDYFIGDRLSALDIYWAVFASLVQPLAQDDNPMPPGMRELYTASPEMVDATPRILLDHRDMMYQRHLSLPLDYLAD